MNTNKKSTIIIYGDYYDPLKDYDNEILGALFRKILYYAKYKEICAEKDNNDVVNALFNMIKHYIDIDIKKYQEKCEQNRRNVLKRHNKNIDNIRP
ncbi:hypothetical protein J6I39_01635 [bacterium]|nr:hypothetical protein [bacterium]